MVRLLMSPFLSLLPCASLRGRGKKQDPSPHRPFSRPPASQTSDCSWAVLVPHLRQELSHHDSV